MPAAVEKAVSDVGNLVTEALPVIGAVVGFIYGGPTGASIGYSLGKAGQGALKGGGGNSNSTAGFTASAQGRDQVIRSSVANRTVVYGRAMVSGPLVFGGVAGEGNKYLWLVIPLAGHEIDAIEAIYLNETEVAFDGSSYATTAPYAGKVLAIKHLGAPGEPADENLVAAGIGWTAAHRLAGVAYLAVRLEWSQDVFPTGIPNIKCVVRGRKVFDPRTGLTVWSQNPALCVRDYITSAHGLEASASEIDTALLVAAANVCDESMALAGGGTEPRYTCNGVLDTGETPRSIMEGMLTSMAGFVVWSGGQYQIHAGAYTAPTVTLTADDLRGAVKVRPRMSRKELFNAVRGTFVDPAAYWQPTDFPTVSNATYAAQDGGQVIWRDAVLPYTTSAATAQRIAKLTMERSRQGITIEMPCKLTAFKVATMSTVMVTLPQLGWAAKEFKVLEWHFSPEGGVDLVLQEETAASYQWNNGMETVRDPAPDTNLGNPFDAPAPQGFALYSGTDALVVQLDGTVSARIRASWSQPANQFVTFTEIEARKHPSTVWEAVAPVDAAQGFGYITPVQDGALYDVRVRHRNTYGVRSAWVESLGHKVIGKTAPPSNVASFLLDGGKFTWPRITDLDVAGYEIRFNYGVNTWWPTATPLHTGIITDAPYTLTARLSGVVTFLLKAVDTSGNVSAEARTIVANLGDPVVSNLVESYPEAPLFAGEVTGASRSGGFLLADGLDLFFEPAGEPMFSPDLDDFYPAGLYGDITYVWSHLAAGAGTLLCDCDVVGSRYTLEYRRGDQGRMFSPATDLMFEPADAPYFGDPSDWAVWTGSLELQAPEVLQFRLVVTGGDVRGEVRALTLLLDVPDLLESFDNLPVSAGGTRLPLAKTYRAIRNVQITVQADGGSGLTARAEDKHPTFGPLIAVYDAAGTQVSGLVDVEIQGY